MSNKRLEARLKRKGEDLAEQKEYVAFLLDTHARMADHIAWQGRKIRELQAASLNARALGKLHSDADYEERIMQNLGGLSEQAGDVLVKGSAYLERMWNQEKKSR